MSHKQQRYVEKVLKLNRRALKTAAPHTSKVSRAEYRRRCRRRVGN